MLHVTRSILALLLLVSALRLVSVARVSAQEATPEAAPISARSGTVDGPVDIGGCSLHLLCQGQEARPSIWRRSPLMPDPTPNSPWSLARVARQ
jgi:hypothetical protein